MTRPRVILISGKAGAGKDTAAEAFTAAIKTAAAEGLDGVGSVVHTLPFAQKLKTVYCDLFGVPPEDLRTYDGKARHRDALIALGQKMREIRLDVWVDYVVREARGFLKTCPEGTVIIPDCRFWNEIARVVEAFGSEVLCVRVSASEEARAARLGDRWPEYLERHQNDPSETQLDCVSPPSREDYEQVARAMGSWAPPHGPVTIEPKPFGAWPDFPPAVMQVRRCFVVLGNNGARDVFDEQVALCWRASLLFNRPETAALAESAKWLAGAR